MEAKHKKWLKYIGQSAMVLLLMGTVVGLYTSVQKDQRQREAKAVQTKENTKLNIAVVNEDQAVKLNDKEYNLGASYVKNIERDNSQNWSVLQKRRQLPIRSMLLEMRKLKTKPIKLQKILYQISEISWWICIWSAF